MTEINEIVIISGKGGTGKTTLALSMVPFIENGVFADCDVDAPDMDIILSKKIELTEDFMGMKKAFIDKEKCKECGECYRKCKFGAINFENNIYEKKCEGCGVCEIVCPVNAIEMRKSINGKVLTSETDYGKLFHARLNPGEENSGLLVSLVRKKTKEYAKKNNMTNILIDGAPGIACNVISSITGVGKVIIVTEPTISGIHDLKRVYEVTQKFRAKVYVVVNKYDISVERTEEIETYCKENNIIQPLRIPFNKKVVEAITNKEIPSQYDKEFYMSIDFFEFMKQLEL